MNSDGQATSATISPQFRIVTDRSRCCGYGLCAALCPDVYKLDAEGLVYVDSEFVASEYEEAAKEGAAACPAEAIVIALVAAA
ncbi:ferredoxin [Glaciimonas sp. GG7]